MESLFGNSDFYSTQLGGPSSPIQLHSDINHLFSSSPKNFFEYFEKDSLKDEEGTQSYAKDDEFSSELEKEADFTFNYDLSPPLNKE